MGFFSDILDNVFGIDPAPAPASPGPSAADLAAAEKRRKDEQTRAGILADAQDADRRKGRQATVFAGQNAEAFGFGALKSQDPVGLNVLGPRTRLGR